MMGRHSTAVFIAAIVSFLLPAVVATAQTPPASGWTLARTPDGQPDLQGIWTNATITPLERPKALAGKTFLTEAEAAALEMQVAVQRVASDKFGPLASGSYNQFWYDSGDKVLSTRQTSLVVDPPDGRVPVRATAEARRDYNAAHNADSYEFMSRWDRCITRGVPGSMFPAGYNNAYQIVQTPGYVVIAHEMIHDARIIPLDLDSSLPRRSLGGGGSGGGGFWMGDSHGRWEGDTLVIETSNFNNKGWISTSAASGRIKGIPHTDQLKLVERLTRVAKDTITLFGDDRRPRNLHEPLDRVVPADRGSGLSHLRVRLPRRQLRPREHPAWRPRRRRRRSRDEKTVAAHKNSTSRRVGSGLAERSPGVRDSSRRSNLARRTKHLGELAHGLAQTTPGLGLRPSTGSGRPEHRRGALDLTTGCLEAPRSTLTPGDLSAPRPRTG